MFYLLSKYILLTLCARGLIGSADLLAFRDNSICCNAYITFGEERNVDPEIYVNYFVTGWVVAQKTRKNTRGITRSIFFDFDSRGERIFREEMIIHRFGKYQRIKGTACPCKQKSPKFVQREALMRVRSQPAADCTRNLADYVCACCMWIFRSQRACNFGLRQSYVHVSKIMDKRSPKKTNVQAVTRAVWISVMCENERQSR